MRSPIRREIAENSNIPMLAEFIQNLELAEADVQFLEDLRRYAVDTSSQLGMLTAAKHNISYRHFRECLRFFNSLAMHVGMGLDGLAQKDITRIMSIRYERFRKETELKIRMFLAEIDERLILGNSEAQKLALDNLCATISITGIDGSRLRQLGALLHYYQGLTHECPLPFQINPKLVHIVNYLLRLYVMRLTQMGVEI